MRRKSSMRGKVVLTVVALVTTTTNFALAQSTQNSTNSDRKVVSRVAPRYPELARKMNIHGTVRVEAVVRPNGSVKSTRVLGGNPVLVNEAVDAVGKWRFEPAQVDTTEVVQLVFETQ